MLVADKGWLGLIIVLPLLATASEMTRCIEPSEIQNRAKVAGCTYPKVYHYLWSPGESKFIEGCFEAKMVPEGYMAVYDKLSRTVNAMECSSETFQPKTYRSNTQCNCSYIKSKCDTSGSIVITNGSTKEDRTCGCDYRRGFDFQHTPKNICSCQPMHENCTCILVNCANGSGGKKSNISTDDNAEGTMYIIPLVAASIVIGIVCFFLGVLAEKKKTVSEYFACLVHKKDDRTSRDNERPGKCENDGMFANVARTGSTIQDDENHHAGTNEHSFIDSGSKSKDCKYEKVLGPRYD